MMRTRSWTSDFVLEQGAVFVKKTGHRIPLNWELWSDIRRWLYFYVRIEFVRIANFFSRAKPKTIAFFPTSPRPWYLIWAVVAAAGFKVVADPEAADIVMRFEDSTTTETMGSPGKTQLGRRQHRINVDCRDVSKTAVAKAFGRAAGYSLEVDPSTWTGLMVDKSEVNAAHDGRVVRGPCIPESGRAYQRLVDNEIGGDSVEDLRTITLGGEPVLVFRKRRSVARRFANENTTVSVARPHEIYTPEEINIIRRFTRELHLDWGGIDVLRDRQDGRIYIVDANKTDMGPPVVLGLGQKLRSVRAIARIAVQRLC